MGYLRRADGSRLPAGLSGDVSGRTYYPRARCAIRQRRTGRPVPASGRHCSWPEEGLVNRRPLYLQIDSWAAAQVHTSIGACHCSSPAHQTTIGSKSHVSVVNPLLRERVRDVGTVAHSSGCDVDGECPMVGRRRPEAVLRRAVRCQPPRAGSSIQRPVECPRPLGFGHHLGAAPHRQFSSHCRDQGAGTVRPNFDNAVLSGQCRDHCCRRTTRISASCREGLRLVCRGTKFDAIERN